MKSENQIWGGICNSLPELSLRGSHEEHWPLGDQAFFKLEDVIYYHYGYDYLNFLTDAQKNARQLLSCDRSILKTLPITSDLINNYHFICGLTWNISRLK